MVAYSFKARFITPIRMGLGQPLVPNDFSCDDDAAPLRPKRQTIRAVGRRRHARAGETLQLYTAMRTKQCQKIGEAKCVYVQPIVIIVYKTKLKIPLATNLNLFARADGFQDAADMHAFWLKEHGLGKFEGVLIRWEPK